VSEVPISDRALNPNTVFVLLGTNLGNREENLRLAKEKIRSYCIKEPTESSIYETTPYGFDSVELFLNQVIIIETFLNAIELLDKLLNIETAMGRTRLVTGYSSRTIDLDILYFNSEIIQNQRLVVPHPRLHERGFTMVPLAEIAPDFIHPILRCSQQHILENLSDQIEVRTHCQSDHRKA